MQNSREVLKKLKIELPYDPAVPLLGIYPKKMKTESQRYLHPMFTAALFTIAKIWEQPKCASTDKGLKELYVWVPRLALLLRNTGMLLSREKEGNPVICNSVGGP